MPGPLGSGQLPPRCRDRWPAAWTAIAVVATAFGVPDRAPIYVETSTAWLHLDVTVWYSDIPRDLVPRNAAKGCPQSLGCPIWLAGPGTTGRGVLAHQPDHAAACTAVRGVEVGSDRLAPRTTAAETARRSFTGQPLATDERNAVERCINRFKQWRGLAMRTDKLATATCRSHVKPSRSRKSWRGSACLSVECRRWTRSAVPDRFLPGWPVAFSGLLCRVLGSRPEQIGGDPVDGDGDRFGGCGDVVQDGAVPPLSDGVVTGSSG